jgi:DNA primase
MHYLAPASMITEESIQLVKDTARVEDVVGDYVNLKRRGQNMLGLCPFHGEKTPSFNVNPSRNIYKCFGCGEGGDPIKFLMTLEQLTYPDAIRRIAAKYNIQLEEKEVSQEVREERQEKEALILVNEFAQKWYEDQLYNTDEGKSIGLSYFKGRGFRRDVMEKFGLGFAPTGRNGLMNAALAAGYKEDQLEQLGLVRNRKDFFWDRVMFTIHNLQGKPIAFAGRILKKDVKAPKYVNSPESEIYHKSDVLYGLYQARQSVRKQDNVYMVEGYTDVISLHQHGVHNVVATSGTSLTSGQAKLVKRQTENVTLLYDGDKAGIKAALRGVDVLLVEGLNVRVVILPDGEDPDSYMQKAGVTAFEEYLTTKRRDFLFFKADLLLEEAGDDVAARSAAIRSSIATLALVEDPLKRAGYLQQFTDRLGLEESLLINLVNQAVADRREKAKKDQEREARREEREARPQVQGRGQRPGLPPVKPQGRNGNSSSSPPEDRWAGMQEPGSNEGAPPPDESGTAPPPSAMDAPDWGGMQDDGGWANMQEPSFDGMSDVFDMPPPSVGGQVPDVPFKDPVAEALLLTGHTFQEQCLVQILILHGAKLYDEEANLSVAAYLTANVVDILGDFDNEQYRKIVLLITDYVGQHNQGPTPEWYLNHPEENIRIQASKAISDPYNISPNWQKHKVYLRQKHPDENQKLYAETFLLLFRMEKIDRKCDYCIQEIARAQKLKDEKTVRNYSKVLNKVLPLKLELAAKLGTVVLRK